MKPRPAVPNMGQFARDMTQDGPIGAILVRLRALPLRHKYAFLTSYLHPTVAWKVLKKDFATGLSMLTELELLQELTRNPRRTTIVISEDVIDLALAFGNKEYFHQLFRLGQKYRVTLKVCTYNASFLGQCIRSWNNPPKTTYEIIKL